MRAGGQDAAFTFRHLGFRTLRTHTVFCISALHFSRIAGAGDALRFAAGCAHFAHFAGRADARAARQHGTGYRRCALRAAAAALRAALLPAAFASRMHWHASFGAPRRAAFALQRLPTRCTATLPRHWAR